MNVEGRFGFMRPDTVGVDPDRAPLRRAPTFDLVQPVDGTHYDLASCEVSDCASAGGLEPELERHGFTHVDLSGDLELQRRLEHVCGAGALSSDDERAIRRRLVGTVLRGGEGRRLRVIFIAREGFILRRTGPNGVTAAKDGEHEAAWLVHVDQDIDGTPVRQIMRGLAPRVFRHDSPLHTNRRAPLCLLNLWIPLDQITVPLALMERGTLDRRRHQLLYGLPTEGILERSQGRRVNDIWTLLHDRGQRWHFTSDMDARRAYVFETASTPHGAFVLPGERRAASIYRRLGQALEGRIEADPASLEDDDRPRTAGLIRACTEGTDALEALARQPALIEDAEWRARARRLRNRMERKSIEMRVVAVPLR